MQVSDQGLQTGQACGDRVPGGILDAPVEPGNRVRLWALPGLVLFQEAAGFAQLQGRQVDELRKGWHAERATQRIQRREVATMHGAGALVEREAAVHQCGQA